MSTRAPTPHHRPTTLRLTDLVTALDFADRSLQVSTFAQVPDLLLDGIARLVGCDGATLTFLDFRTHREVVLFRPGAEPPADVLRDYPEVGSSHPLRRPLASRLAHCPAPQPLRISDVMSRRQWQGTALSATTHRGLSDQMCLPLAVRGSVLHAVTLGRRDNRTFNDRQRDLFALTRNHLTSAIARARREPHLRARQLAPIVSEVSVVDALTVINDQQSNGRLSPRERDVLSLVAGGLTDTQIARRLGLAPATVSKHLHRIYLRLQLPNRAAATHYWHQLTDTASAP